MVLTFGKRVEILIAGLAQDLEMSEEEVVAAALFKLRRHADAVKTRGVEMLSTLTVAEDADAPLL